MYFILNDSNNVDAINIDEQVPIITPMIIGKLKDATVEPPNIYNENKEINVDVDVSIVLDNVSLRLLFIIFSEIFFD